MKDLTNYLGIQEAQNNKQSQDISFIMLSNCNIDNSKNIDTTLYSTMSSTQTLALVNGNYSGYTGYIIIEDEIMLVSNSTWNGTYTTMTISRGKLNTIASSHISGRILRDGQRIREVLSWEYADRAEATQNSLFSSVLSKGRVLIGDDVDKYDKKSATKLYNIKNNKFIYIFNGSNGEVLCEFVGYIFRPFSQDFEQYVIPFRDRLSLVWGEPLDLNLNFSNATIKEVLSQVLNIPEVNIEYANGTLEDDYFTIDEISTNEYETYDSFLQALCSNNLLRFVFERDEKIRVFSDVKINNIVSQKTITSQKFIDLNAKSDDNKVVINKVKCEYKERNTLYNREDFLSGTTLKYINFYYSQSVYLQLMDSNGFKNNTITIGSGIKNISTVNNKYYLMLKDTLTGDEFYCGATTINTTTQQIELVGGFDLDRKSIYYRDKLSYLISQGYTSNRNFTLYYGSFELPDVFSLNFDNKNNNNLEIPILPQETIRYVCTFGTPTVDNKQFTGIIKEIDNIFNTTLTNTQLKYNQRYTQGDTGFPIYMMTNKLGLTGSGESQSYTYSSFDNSNVQVVLERATDNKNNFNLYFNNTLSVPTIYTFTPVNTISNVLQVSNINNYNTGDVLKLSSSNESIADNEELYLKLREEKWIIKNKFTDGSQHFIVLNRGFPIGDNGTQFVCDKYLYSSIILLNNFSIKGNPVMESIINIENLDQTSIDDEGKKEYVLDGKFLKINDLEIAIDYLKNGFKNTNDISQKRFIEFEIDTNLDLQVLDVITLTDNVRMNFTSKDFIILERNVNCVGTTTYKFKAITLNEYEVTGESINIENTINYIPVTLPVYDHQGNSGLSTEEPVNLDNSILSLQSDKVGLVTFAKIDRSTYKATSGTNLRDGYTTLTISNITGDLSTYNIMLLNIGEQCVIRINDEFLLVEGLNTVTSSTTTTTVKIVDRDLFKKGETDISIGNSIEFYQIIQISNENGNYFTNTVLGSESTGQYMKFTPANGLELQGTLTIGGDRGSIILQPSGIRIDDATNIYGSDTLIIYDSIDNGIYSIATGTDYSNCVLAKEDLFYESIIENIGNTGTISLYDFNDLNNYLPITINGLKFPQMNGNTTLVNGEVSYHSSGFYGRSEGSWKRLDNYGIDDNITWIDGNGDTHDVTIVGGIITAWTIT